MKYLLLCVLLVGLVGNNLLAGGAVKAQQQAVTRQAAAVKAAGTQQLNPCPQHCPSGSYQSTCPLCSTDGVLLYCLCNYKDQAKPNSLLIRERGEGEDIANCSGVLRYGQCIDLPKGSYQSTCSNCGITNNKLFCLCNYPDESKVFLTSLTVDPKDTRDIANCWGTLKYGQCIDLPKGSYLSTCYDCNVSNNSLSWQLH